MTTILNASPSNGLVQTADGSGVIKVQSNGVTTNALAWVNFNGTSSTPITPRASYNVSSVTKNGTGDYTLNFANALTDANYSAVCSAGDLSTSAKFAFGYYGTAPTTSAYRIATSTFAGTNSDISYVAVAIFGN